MQTLEYRTIDKNAWGVGPWQKEPDKRQWQDAATGLPCLAVRHDLAGHWCGYVGVASDHPWHGLDYGDVEDVHVHGGLTFADACQPGNETTSICHVPDSGEPADVWWFGFDCAHIWDISPGYLLEYEYTIDGECYRDLAYVAAECATLARQLNEMRSR